MICSYAAVSPFLIDRIMSRSCSPAVKGVVIDLVLQIRYLRRIKVTKNVTGPAPGYLIINNIKIMNTLSVSSSVHTIRTILKYTFGLVPIVAGADKFLNLLTDWT